LTAYERTGDGADRRVYAQYDGLGHRVEKGTQQGQGNVAWTQYTYQQLSLDVLAEFPQTGPPRVNYLYWGRAGAGRSTSRRTRSTTWTRYVHVEPNGYSGSGNTPVSPQQPVPVNSSQQGNSP